MDSEPRFAASLETLHEEARKATGLDDFGDPAYREGLAVLLESLDEDANLSPLGRAISPGADREDPRHAPARRAAAEGAPGGARRSPSAGRSSSPAWCEPAARRSTT